MLSLPGQHFLSETLVVAATGAFAQTVTGASHFQHLLAFAGNLVQVLPNLGVFPAVLQLLVGN